jgi:hypothetical protein
MVRVATTWPTPPSRAIPRFTSAVQPKPTPKDSASTHLGLEEVFISTQTAFMGRMLSLRLLEKIFYTLSALQTDSAQATVLILITR